MRGVGRRRAASCRSRQRRADSLGGGASGADRCGDTGAGERGGSGGGSSDDAVLVVDAWIRFRLPFRVATLVLGVRAQLAAVLQKKIERPTLELSVAGKGILDAVTALLEQSV